MSVRRAGLSRSLQPWARVVGGTLLTQQLADGPLAAWPMQDTQLPTMLDASGNNRNGTYNSGPLIKQSPLIHGSGYAVTFDGTNDYADAGQAAWTDQTTALSFEIVVKRGGVVANRWIMARYNYSYGALFWGVGMNATGNLFVQANRVVTGADLDWNVHLVTVTYSYPGFTRLYLDGTLVGELATTGAIGYTWYSTFQIATNSGASYFALSASHAAFYNKVLTTADVLRHAKAAGLA